MTDAVACALKAHESSAHHELLSLTFARECAERVRHLLEDQSVTRCLDVLAAYVEGRADRGAIDRAAAQAAALANGHPGSRSLDGVGHAAVSASYAVANALAGRAVQAADYAAYAVVYGDGGHGAVSDPDSFVAEMNWQLATLEQLANALAMRGSPSRVEPAVTCANGKAHDSNPTT